MDPRPRRAREPAPGQPVNRSGIRLLVKTVVLSVSFRNMSSEERGPHLEVRDPRMMRALAHPLRVALIEAIGQADTGTLTATEASDLLGESPANCAFHLRTLAKYGFVEEAGAAASGRGGCATAASRSSRRGRTARPGSPPGPRRRSGSTGGWPGPGSG